ncbi:MAG: hypothetical protein LBS04_07985 [Tannerellaceae bacterium]|jgi:heme exporter protein D|nr:hypothetical protein [Tannerellaceae bacterium]
MVWLAFAGTLGSILAGWVVYIFLSKKALKDERDVRAFYNMLALRLIR